MLKKMLMMVLICGVMLIGSSTLTASAQDVWCRSSEYGDYYVMTETITTNTKLNWIEFKTKQVRKNGKVNIWYNAFPKPVNGHRFVTELRPGVSRDIGWGPLAEDYWKVVKQYI